MFASWMTEGQTKISEPFFTTKEMGRAMGSGLPINHGIIENHKGRIEVESETSKGAAFRVILPEEGNHG